MKRTVFLAPALAVGAALALFGTAAADPPSTSKPAENSRAPESAADASKSAAKVYGEWRIHVKPDKGVEYDTLIAERGLPLFRKAGGRMVGWWKTLIGDLYEHVTIWEYDGMAGFERAIGILGSDKAFAEFVSHRDPLLAGEENRFLRLGKGAVAPTLDEPAKFVIHEVHRVPLAAVDRYLALMESRGLPLLKKHGFRPVGPWRVDVGSGTEITYLFLFESPSERERLMAQFPPQDAAEYTRIVNEAVSEITTRLLIPAPFAKKVAQSAGPAVSSELLPHLQEVAPGVFAAGFADRFKSANCGWSARGESVTAIDFPRGIGLADYFREIERISRKPVRTLALTHLDPGDEHLIAAAVSGGVNAVITSPAIQEQMISAFNTPSQKLVKTGTQDASGHALTMAVADGVLSRGAAAFFLPESQVLFAGPLVVNGPRTPLPGSNSDRWIFELEKLRSVGADRVVPGFGSWGEAPLVDRQLRFLKELRRQVSFVISQGRPVSALKTEVRLPADVLVWMPYDTPTAEDVDHVYRELTVPLAPFHGMPPDKTDPRVHALVLVADQPHEPGHVVEGLLPAFEATGVVPHFAVDVRALGAENLALVKLLVILRDGLMRPSDDAATHYEWMTPEQQEAVSRFVHEGGGFLNLHNSMGLYPAGGEYLNLVGGRYIGHGPLERFRVEVVDGQHPVTRGVEGFGVADEQHTPPYDADKVQLLLRSRSDDGKTVAAAGWAYEPGRGRLCHLANGHTRESLAHPMFQRLLRNAIRWCARQE